VLEKKKIFVDAFNKKADDLIKQSDEKIAQYTAARQKAIKLTDPISLSFSKPQVSFSTIGELFAWVYPEAGGSEVMPEGFAPVILENLAGKDSPGKAEYKILHKNFYEPVNKTTYIQLKELGGEGWLKLFMSSALDKMAQVKQKISDYKIFSDFETVLDDLSEGIILYNLPGGLVAPLYDAFIESGNATPETPSSPVNATETPKPAGSAPINDTTKSEKSKPASALNPEKSAQTPLETTTGTVTAGKSELPKEVGKGPETGAPAVVVNVESAASKLPASPAPAEKPTTPTAAPSATQSKPAAAPSPVNSSKETLTNNVTTNNISAEKTTSSFSTNDAALLKKYTGVSVNVPTAVGGAASSTINNISTSKNTENNKSSADSKTSTSSTNSSVNEITNKEEQNIEKSSESESAESTTNNISSSDAMLLKKYAGFDVSASKKGAADKTGSTEVVKTKPALPAVKAPEVKAQLPAEPIDKKTEPVTAKEVKSESPEAESPAKATSAPTESAGQAATSGSMNTGDIESRLARIEYLLSGTLDVKIVE